jgi:phage-related baseplate assembly protein
MAIDLTSLPAPQVIEVLDYETILARKVTSFQNLWEAVRTSNPSMNLPDYDVSMLETDPVKIVLEADAYDELALRSRVNDAAKANLLPFAVGGDLDNLVASEGVVRMDGETDDRLRQRYILKVQGSSAAGPEEWYKYWAMTADIRVADVAVYRSGTGPELTIAILSTQAGGVPTQDLLDAVYAVVNASDVRGLNDVLTVTGAATSVVNVAGQVWLLPTTPQSVFDGLEATLRAAAIAEGGIGFDINRAWVIARIMVPGVSNFICTSPVSDQVEDANNAATIGTVTLQYMGRSR